MHTRRLWRRERRSTFKRTLLLLDLGEGYTGNFNADVLSIPQQHSCESVTLFYWGKTKVIKGKRSRQYNIKPVLNLPVKSGISSAATAPRSV
jgi:hypothetical protein